MKNYVFIGFNGLFGDYADIVQACGGRLVKIVYNLPLETNTGTQTFARQLDLYHRFQERVGNSERVELQPLRDFKPRPGDHHILASRGVTLTPLSDYLMHDLGVFFEPLVHAQAMVSPTVELPQGVIIHNRAHVGSNVKLGRFSAIKVGVYVGHDCEIGDFADLSPEVTLASGVKIGHGARLGISSTVINDISIGEGAYVAAGAVVTKDVAPLTMVAGVPAVFKKTIEPRSIPKTVHGLE